MMCEIGRAQAFDHLPGLPFCFTRVPLVSVVGRDTSNPLSQPIEALGE
jgi:hypothetical protein